MIPAGLNDASEGGRKKEKEKEREVQLSRLSSPQVASSPVDIAGGLVRANERHDKITREYIKLAEQSALVIFPLYSMVHS